MKKKILILSNSDCGLYNFRKELILRILKENEVFLCLPNGIYREYFENIGCEYIECQVNRHGTNIIEDIKLINFYKKILINIRPDIVLTYTIKPNVYGGMVCSKLKIPYVVNITGLGTAVENSGIMQKITLFLYKMGLKNAKKVFFQNATNQGFMINKGVIKTEYDLIPGSGVNLKEYPILEYPDNETLHFSFISRIMKEKGIEQYLAAAKYFHKEGKNMVFHVCGSCEQEYGNLLKQLHEEGIIVFHGRVEDVTEIHKFSHCTIHPTYYPEGLSNVLLESCACGRPIITTDRAGCREVVNDGINGYIVNKKDSNDLINKILKFESLTFEERRLMGLAGREKVEKNFDRQIVIEKYMKEIQ